MVDPVAPARSVETLLIGTFDVSGFVRGTHGFDDERVAAMLDSLYFALDKAVTGSGGRIVKFMGDGALAVWPPEQADAAVAAILDVRGEVAASLLDQGLRGELIAKLHCGKVVAGEFGPARTFDVMGAEVFVAFKLPARTLSLSAEAFRRLNPEMRTRLKKHSEPVVYIPTEDPRP